VSSVEIRRCAVQALQRRWSMSLAGHEHACRPACRHGRNPS
jgi:hypothetical protein